MPTSYPTLKRDRSFVHSLFALLAACLLFTLLLSPFDAERVRGQGSAPALLYSSYIGGNGADSVRDIAVDAEGNILVIGQTFADILLGVEIERKGYSDLFVAKFDPSGKELLYLTVLGGHDSEIPLAIEVDAQGNAYGTATAFDETFPTQNALWPAASTEANYVLFKLDTNGEVVYSTYLPDNSTDSKQNLAVDSAGNAYVTATRWGVEEGDQFLFAQMSFIKIDPSGTQLLLDRHVGGSGTEYANAIAVDSTGMIYLAGTTNSDTFPVTENALQTVCGEKLFDPNDYCGNDVIVAVFSPTGELRYASYHGGNAGDEAGAIAADGTGNFVVAGDTISGNFPVVNALQSTCPLDDEQKCYLYRGFASRFHLDANGQIDLVYSTYLGGSDRNSITEVLDATVDSAGNAYISGYTNGKQFPTKDPIQPYPAEGFCLTFSSERYCFDGFVTVLAPNGSLLFGTYLGGVIDEFAYGIAVDGEGNLYVAGTTESSDFPTTTNAFQPLNQLNDDGFLVKIGEADDTPTATSTATPTGTVQPSVTPTVSVTPQASVTPQTTGTPQASVTPQVTPTQQGSQTPQVPPLTPQAATHSVLLPSIVR